MSNSKKYFVFVDETGNNNQEDLFILGCVFVPVDRIGEYYEQLNKIFSKIKTKVKDKELELEKNLSEKDLVSFYRGRRRAYEVKFKHINQTVAEAYTWLVSQYFKFSDIRFCCLVIDKKKYPPPKSQTFCDVYTNDLALLLKHNIKEGEEVVILPDNIEISGDKHFEDIINKKLLAEGKNIFGTHRLESHANLFVQMTDLLIGAVAYDYHNKSNLSKDLVVNKIKQKTGLKSLGVNATKHNPNYFSIWVYKR